MRVGGVALALALLVLGGAPVASAQSPLAGAPQLLPEGGFPGLLPAGPIERNPQPGPVPGCKRPAIRCVQTMLTAMRRLRARLGCDHRAVFANTYIAVTAETLRFLRDQPGYFDDPAWLTYLDVLFADYYFRSVSAYAAGQPVPESWRIAFSEAARGDEPGARTCCSASTPTCSATSPSPRALLRPGDPRDPRPLRPRRRNHQPQRQPRRQPGRRAARGRLA